MLLWLSLSAKEPTRALVALGRMDLVQCRSKTFRELVGVLVGPEMHEKQARLVVQHVMVERRDFNVILTECPESPGS